MPPKGRRRPADSSGGGGDAGVAREWGHPDGMELSEIEIDSEYDGVVTNVGRFGVFVDFGAVKDGLLKVPLKIGRGFKRGMEVKSMVVISCEPDEGRVVLAPQDETVLPEPPPRASGGKGGKGAAGKGGKGGGRGAGRGALKDAGGGGKVKGRSTPRDWGHADGTAVEDVREGEIWDGVVTNVSPYGVFVDIGCSKDARLSVPTKIGRRFRIGDSVPDCKVEYVDANTERITVTLDDPEEVVRDLPSKERAERPKAAPKAKSTAKAKGRSSSPARQALPASGGAKAKPRAKKAQGAASSIERLRVGQIVDGFVSNKNSYGIFVDIGVDKDAKLLVAKRLQSSFRKNDEVCGMVVESVDLERNQIAVSLEDPELDGDNEAPAPRGARPVAQAASQPKGKAKAKAKAKSPVPSQNWNHPDALPVSSFKVGHIADGIVTNIQNQGVFIDIGATRDGVLKVSRALAKEFRVNDEVHGMVVEAVDLKNERVTLSLEDPELKEPGVNAAGGGGGGAARRSAKSPQAKTTSAGPPSSKAKAQPKAKAKAKGQGGNTDWAHAGGNRLEDLQVGSEVSGVVTNRGKFGVFLDIGAVKDGKLRLQKDEWRKFRKGDEVEEMIIEHVDVETEQITLALTYELGDEPEELEVEATPRQAKAKARAGTAPLPSTARTAPPRPSGRGMATRPATAKAKARRV